MCRGILLFLAAFAATAALARSADAATIALDPGTQRITYTATAGEVNNLTVTATSGPAGELTFTDAAGVVIADGDGPLDPAGCTVDALLANIARCPAAGVGSITVDAGDGDDIVHMNAGPPDGTRIHGGPGFDRLYGGPGSDDMTGDAGADIVWGDNGDDTVDTGVGGLDPNNPLCLNELEELIIPLCQDFAGGGSGIDTITYATRDFAVYVDTRSWTTPLGHGNMAVDDPDPTCLATANIDVVRPDCQIDSFTGADQTGNDFFERLVGGPADDELVGSKFPNTLIGGGGADTLCGGQGDDTVDYSGHGTDVTVTMVGPLPTDPNSALGGPAGAQARIDCRTALIAFQGSIPQPPGPDAPRDCDANDGRPGEHDCVGEDVENAIGGAGDDTLSGNEPDKDINEGPNLEPRGANDLQGGPGDDTLIGLWGPDTFTGGAGDDTVSYADRTGERTEDVVASLDGSGNDGSRTAVALDKTGGTKGDFNPFSGRADSIDPDVENILGGDGNDTLTGSAAANRLTGSEGNDALDGLDGGDTLDAGNGNDRLAGGDGCADQLFGGEGDDSLDGGAGNDMLNASSGHDVLHGGTGADTLLGGPGTDTADWADATSGVTVSLNGIADDGQAGEQDNAASDIEGANGGLADDTLVLGDGDGRIQGGAGNDRLDGGPGADAMHGGPGLDTADYSSRVAPLSVDTASGTADGEGGEQDDVLDDVEQILGGSANDVLAGAGAANLLFGNGGDDQLFGKGGNDQLFGGAGGDALDGGDDGDTLDGGDSNDSLLGRSGADTLMGGGGDDGLDGGAGGDSLAGGAGTDTASYATRTLALALTLEGNPNDGESGENDLIKMDVENAIGGSGDDLVGSKNGIRNSISCGGGSDQISADTFDDVAGDCERIINASPCKVSPTPASMTSRGVVTVKVSCTDDASGSLLLQTHQTRKQLQEARKKARRKARKSDHLKAKRITLGRGSFRLKRGQNTKVKVRMSGSGKRMVQRRKKGLAARATITVRQSFGVRAMSLENGEKLVIKAKK